MFHERLEQIPDVSVESRVFNPQGAGLTIPIDAAKWKKLSRETQVKILDELGILRACE